MKTKLYLVEISAWPYGLHMEVAAGLVFPTCGPSEAWAPPPRAWASVTSAPLVDA